MPLPLGLGSSQIETGSLPPKINWSEYQKAIFEDVKSSKENLFIKARAGSAKTTTLLESLKYIPHDKKTLVVAFNKKIAEELKSRAPEYSNLTISTLHSFGYLQLRNAFGKVKLDTEKSFRIIKGLLEPLKDNPKDRDDYTTIFEIKKCVSLCKLRLCDTPSKIDLLMDDFDISNGSLDRDVFIRIVIQTLGECKKKTDSVDFDDMLYMCFVLNPPIEKYDVVLIDEAQDLSNVGLFLATSAVKKDGRVIVFCDNFQVLYEFAGVEIDGVSKLQEKLKAKSLPLPISYRCAKAIIFKAQKLVPDIQYRPGAPDGKIHTITESKVIETIRPGDMVVSRTNAPLVRLCLNLWRAKIPANIKGKELGPSLTGVVKQSGKKNIKAFLSWLSNWEKTEIARLKAKNRDTKTVADKVECLEILSEGKTTVEELLQTIKSLFEDKNTDNIVSLMTVHISKGGEAKRVYFLEYTMIFGNTQSEKNIRYVAITRAKEDLFLVSKI